MLLDELLKERHKLLETIGNAADQISKIDSKIAVLHSQELEIDLNQAAEKAAEANS